MAFLIVFGSMSFCPSIYYRLSDRWINSKSVFNAGDCVSRLFLWNCFATVSLRSMTLKNIKLSKKQKLKARRHTAEIVL